VVRYYMVRTGAAFGCDEALRVLWCPHEDS
jgi:hypothetical protein